MISTIIGASPKIIPRVTPKGDAKANMKMSQKMILVYPSKDLPRDIESETPSADLWIRTATIRSTHELKFDSSPIASPSNMA